MFSQEVEIFQAANELSWFFRNNSLHVGPCDRRVTGMVNIAINSHHLHDLGQDFEIMGKAGKIVRLVRVMRVMRIFKLVRHFAGLQSLIYTLNQVSAILLLPSLLHSSLARPTRSSGCSCCWWGSRSLHLPLWSTLPRRSSDGKRNILQILIFSG